MKAKEIKLNYERQKNQKNKYNTEEELDQSKLKNRMESFYINCSDDSLQEMNKALKKTK